MVDSAATPPTVVGGLCLGAVGGPHLGCCGRTVPGVWWDDRAWGVVGGLYLGCDERTVPGVWWEDCV